VKPALIAITLGLLLAGCPRTPITLKTVILSPPQINGSYQYWYSQNAWCSVPLPGQGLFLNGLGPEPLGPSEIYSGFEDIYDQGAQPFPCEEQQQTLYRGQVAFDLGEFDSIVDATLNFDVAQSIAENGGVNTQIPPVSNATTLRIKWSIFLEFRQPRLAAIVRAAHKAKLFRGRKYAGQSLGHQ